jgi:hypothetical protein
VIEDRRAVEALRSGVPNRDAVKALGTTQNDIASKFAELLRLLNSTGKASGLLIGGEFGSGKSHLLEYLQHSAQEQRFVTSKIVISKETPLHDIAKVFRAAVESMVVPGHRGSPLVDLVTLLDFQSDRHGRFRAWADDPNSRLNERFAATLYLMENSEDEEFKDRILRFWSGDAIPVGDLNRNLRACGESSTWSFSKASVKELALQRFRFVGQLIKAAGYEGWVLLFDEAELIGRYSLLQRGRAYSELARWIRGFDTERIDHVGCIMAITKDFATAVLRGDKHDLDAVPNRLRAKGDPADDLTAARAEIGMRIIDKEMVDLKAESAAVIDEAYEKVRGLHANAFSWTPPEVSGVARSISRVMREYVRGWIFEWDLKRLDPSYRPEIEIGRLHTSYTEDPELEGAEGDEWENPEAEV